MDLLGARGVAVEGDRKMQRLSRLLGLSVLMLLMLACDGVVTDTPTPGSSGAQKITTSAATPTAEELAAVGKTATSAPTLAATPTSAPEQAEEEATEDGNISEALAMIELPQEGDVVAVVNGRPIPVRRYLEFMRLNLYAVTAQQQIDWQSEERLPLLKRVEWQVLEQLISMTLLRQEAEREQMLPSPEEIARSKEQVAAQIAKQGQYGSLAEYQQAMHLSDETFDLIVEDSLIMARMREKHGQVSPVEQVHAAHILVSDKTEAQKLLQRIRRREDFQQLAKLYSQDETTSQQGGDLGWFPRGVMVPSFEKAAFALKPGSVSEVVQTSFGYHLIKVLGKEVRPLDPPLAERAQQEAFDRWLEEVRGQATIERYIQKGEG